MFCRWEVWEGKVNFAFVRWFINLSSSFFSLKVNLNFWYKCAIRNWLCTRGLKFLVYYHVMFISAAMLKQVVKKKIYTDFCVCVCFISFYFSGQMLTCYIFSVSQAKTHCMLDFSFWSNLIMKQVVRVLQGNPSLVTALAAIILVFLVHPALGLFVLLFSHSLCCHSMLCWYGSSLNSFLDCSYDVWINQGNKFVAYSWICITIC